MNLLCAMKTGSNADLRIVFFGMAFDRMLCLAGASLYEAAHQRRLSQVHTTRSYLQLRLLPWGAKYIQVGALEFIKIARWLED